MGRPAPLRVEMVEAVEAEITHLESLDREALRARWRVTLGRTAPSHLGRGLLFRILAYRVQAERFGDLDPATARFLDRALRSSQPSVPMPDAEIARPGTVLVREWQGVMHRVEGVPEGYRWDGRTFPSLSGVARAITGSRWNGPRFFGLRRAGS